MRKINVSKDRVTYVVWMTLFLFLALQSITSCNTRQEVSLLKMVTESEKKCEKFADLDEFVGCLNVLVESSTQDPIAHIIKSLPGKVTCGTSPESPQRADETHPRCFLQVDANTVVAYLIDNDPSLHLAQNDGIGNLFADFQYSEKRMYTAKEAVDDAAGGSHSCVGCHDPVFTKGLSVVRNKVYGVPYGELKKMEPKYRIEDSKISTYLTSLMTKENCSSKPESIYCERLYVTLNKVSSDP